MAPPLSVTHRRRLAHQKKVNAALAMLANAPELLVETDAQREEREADQRHDAQIAREIRDLTRRLAAKWRDLVAHGAIEAYWPQVLHYFWVASDGIDKRALLRKATQISGVRDPRRDAENVDRDMHLAAALELKPSTIEFRRGQLDWKDFNKGLHELRRSLLKISNDDEFLSDLTQDIQPDTVGVRAANVPAPDLGALYGLPAEHMAEARDRDLVLDDTALTVPCFTPNIMRQLRAAASEWSREGVTAAGFEAHLRACRTPAAKVPVLRTLRAAMERAASQPAKVREASADKAIEQAIAAFRRLAR